MECVEKFKVLTKDLIKEIMFGLQALLPLNIKK